MHLPLSVRILLVLSIPFLVPRAGAANALFTGEVLGGARFFSPSADAFDVDVDARGNVHVLYRGATVEAFGLVHAIRRPGGWVRELMPGGSDVDEADMLVDPDGTIHVAAEGNLQRLYYFRREAGRWSRTTVEADSGISRLPQILRDADGDLEILAGRGSEPTIYSFVRSGGQWQAPVSSGSASYGGFDRAYFSDVRRGTVYETSTEAFRYQLSTSATAGSYAIHDGDKLAVGTPDLDVDPGGFAHVVGLVFDNVLSEYLGFHFTAGSTTYFPADVDASTLSARVAVDGQSRVHAFYTNRSIIGVRYHLRENGTWTRQDIPGRTRAIAVDVDAYGNPYVLSYGRDSYFFDSAGVFLDRPVGGEVLVADEPVEVEWNGAGAVDVELSTDGGVTWSSLAAGVSGGRATVTLPPIATDDARVRVVRRDPFTVSTSPAPFTIVPSREGTGVRTVLAPVGADALVDLEVAADGTAHAVWLDPAVPSLSYGMNVNGAWMVETVDATNDPRGRPMLDLAPDGTPVVIYAEEGGGTLRVGRRPSGPWVFDEVDDGADVAAEFDVLVTADGATHVAWYDDVRQQLVAARQASPGGSWAVTDVGSGQAGWGRGFDMETDGVDVWIVFNDDSSGSGLHTARRPIVGGAWTIDFDDLGGLEAVDPELAIDAAGTRYIAFRQPEGPFATQLVVTRSSASGRVFETLPGSLDASEHPFDLAVSADGMPHVLVNDAGSTVRIVRVGPGQWTRIEHDGASGDAAVPAIAVGGDSQPRIVRPLAVEGTQIDEFRGLHLISPIENDLWPVGAVRTVTWSGPGPVDVELSIDGGASWSTMGDAIEGGSFDLQVPQLPTRFARVRLVRDAPASTVEMPGLFSIESSIALLNLNATPLARGVELRWESDPGPEDLAGYRVERRQDGGWTTLASALTEPRYVDLEGGSGDRYRVQATNRLGASVVLGETSVGSSFRLRVWPSPLVDGPLNVAFDAGRRTGVRELVVYDVRGRRVRTLFADDGARGLISLTWDGRDDAGRPVASGAYFVALRGADVDATRKVLIAR